MTRPTITPIRHRSLLSREFAVFLEPLASRLARIFFDLLFTFSLELNSKRFAIRGTNRTSMVVRLWQAFSARIVSDDLCTPCFTKTQVSKLLK